ncbi:sensor histidine kinase [Bradyrhizobium barranii]|uniref:histidine kinase n=1 Tax=Bradyrhizobium barranii TaxID=2992140 RepID=A0ABY3QGV2_9BRAD|nr:sensor histidine kinase [Bradyrhizobium japonicum]UFW85055.1 sensor histidine kinase [Bradyrhizobium japonicum]
MEAEHMQTNHSSSNAQKIVDLRLEPVSVDHLLIQELSHRVKNELTSVIGLAVSIARRSTSHEVKSALAKVSNTLHCYAVAHRALQMPLHCTEIEASEYVTALCHSLSCARLDPQGIELVLALRPFKLRSERCWKLGLILSELITNSARHAFGNRGGIIEVTLRTSGLLAECCVKDNGSAQSPHGIGQGLKIVAALAKELGGAMSHEFGPEGTTSTVTFPIHNDELAIDAKAIRPGST